MDIELVESAIKSEAVVFTASAVDDDAKHPVSSYVATREEIIRGRPAHPGRYFPGVGGDARC